LEGPGQDEHQDFLWIVSPPYRTAPHLYIGAGYNLTAHESLTMGARDFHFVINQRDYDEALMFYESFNGASIDRSMQLVQQIKRLGKGTLNLAIVDFQVRRRQDRTFTNVIDSITFKATACIPR
jgi:hypothetical protein